MFKILEKEKQDDIKLKNLKMKWIINIVNLIKNNKKMNEMKDKRKINPIPKTLIIVERSN